MDALFLIVWIPIREKNVLNIKKAELDGLILSHPTSCKSCRLEKRYLLFCTCAEADEMFFNQLPSVDWLPSELEVS